MPKVNFYLMFLRFYLPKVIDTLKTLNKSLRCTKTFKNVLFSNRSCSHGSKLAVFTTFFKGFRAKSILLFNVFKVLPPKHRKPHAWIREQLSKSSHLPDPTHPGTKYPRSGEPLTPICLRVCVLLVFCLLVLVCFFLRGG